MYCLIKLYKTICLTVSWWIWLYFIVTKLETHWQAYKTCSLSFPAKNHSLFVIKCDSMFYYHVYISLSFARLPDYLFGGKPTSYKIWVGISTCTILVIIYLQCIFLTVFVYFLYNCAWSIFMLEYGRSLTKP